MKCTRLITAILIVFGASAFVLGQTPVSMNGKLKLVGNQLSSECGNPVQLRGLSSHGLQWYGDCLNGSFSTMQSDWKADIVRLVMYVNEGGYLSDTAYWKTRIDRLVDQVGALGMYCIIDWHILTPGDPNLNLDNARYFWKYMSKKHAGKKHVIYEICNEPNGVNWASVKSYAQTIIPIIRANDPETIIVVGTPQWSGKPGDVISGGPLTGANAYNVMYAFHFYAASHSSYKSEVQAAAKSIPIFATEWGLSEASGTGNISLSEGQLWMDIFNGNNQGNQKISWCYWSFSDKNETSAALTPNACTTSLWNSTTTAGTQVKTWLTTYPKNFISCGPTCKSPNLGNDVTLCGATGGAITLNSGLTATNRTFSWKRNNVAVTGSATTLSVNTAGTYSVTVDSAGCQKTDEIVVSATLPTPSLGSGSDLCNPSTATLDAGVSGTGFSYSWKRNNTTLAATTKTLTVSEAGTYSVTVSASGCPSTSNSVVITSSLPTVKGDTICSPGGIATLTASGTGPFDWYDVVTGGTKLFTSSSYNPNVSSTKTFYVQATPGQDYKFGPAVRGTAAWDITDFNTGDKQLIINALGNVTLKSVDVDPQSGAQNVTINVTDVTANTIVKTVTQAIPASLSTINVGANLVSGKKYRIDAIGTSGRLYFRNQGNTLWPQTTANIATVQANDGVSWANSWSLFFNIIFSTGKACNRVPVEAKVDICNTVEEAGISSQNVQVFPNPFEDNFHLHLGNTFNQVERIDLFNLEGKILDSRQGTAISSEMTMGEFLSPGHYLIRLVSRNNVIAKSVFKTK